MGVDVFDKLYNFAQEENRDNASLIRKFKQDDFTQKLADIETELSVKESEYKLIDIQLNASKEEVEQHNQKLISLNEKIVQIKSDNYSSLRIISLNAFISPSTKFSTWSFSFDPFCPIG